eukprot:1830334-Amphidinium_carterae.1
MRKARCAIRGKRNSVSQSIASLACALDLLSKWTAKRQTAAFSEFRRTRYGLSLLHVCKGFQVSPAPPLPHAAISAQLSAPCSSTALFLCR